MSLRRGPQGPHPPFSLSGSLSLSLGNSALRVSGRRGVGVSRPQSEPDTNTEGFASVLMQTCTVSVRPIHAAGPVGWLAFCPRETLGGSGKQMLHPAGQTRPRRRVPDTRRATPDLACRNFPSWFPR